MTRYFRNIIKNFLCKYEYFKFILLYDLNRIIGRIILLYFILISIFYTLYFLLLILGLIIYNWDFFNAQMLLLEAAQQSEILRCSYTNIISEYKGETPSDILNTQGHIGLSEELGDSITSELSMGEITSDEKKDLIIHITYLKGDTKHQAIEILRKLNLVQTEATLDEAEVADIDEAVVEYNDEDIDEDSDESMVDNLIRDFNYNGTNELLILDTLLNIHRNVFDISDYTYQFPLHRLELEMNFNRIFGFSNNYENLYNYSFFIQTETVLMPHFFSFTLLIGPQGGFPFDKSLTYIPTDIFSTEVNTAIPIIQGEFLLPNTQDPFNFITNLVSLKEFKDQEPLLEGDKITIKNIIGTPTEIDIIKAQRYIQGTVRVALLKEIEILDKLYK